jgi:hypothetical protein
MIAKRVERTGIVFLIGLFSAAAHADPPLLLTNYRFITDRSVVDVTGGVPGVDMSLNILGKFGLVTGYNYEPGGPTAHAPSLTPFAQFTDVKGMLFDPRRATPTAME